MHKYSRGSLAWNNLAVYGIIRCRLANRDLSNLYSAGALRCLLPTRRSPVIFLTELKATILHLSQSVRSGIRQASMSAVAFQSLDDGIACFCLVDVVIYDNLRKRSQLGRNAFLFEAANML